MGLRQLIGIFSLMIFLSDIPVDVACMEPLPVYILERDTLQTRNFTPVINHQTMLVNLGERPLTLDLKSAFPNKFYKKGDGYPAFLDDSLIADPVFSPFEIAPKKVSYLPRPDIIVDPQNTSFIWSKVELPDSEAVVAQYDNYYGEQNCFWRESGFDFEGIQVKTDYAVQTDKNGRITISLSFLISNNSNYDVQDFNLGVFVPVRQLLKDSEVSILETEKICTSANVEASRITKSDGFGEAADGIAAAISVKEFTTEMQKKFSLSISGIPSKKTAISWPILTVTGRSIRPGIWPSTVIKTDTLINQGSFSYLSYNLVIKDRQYFKISPQNSTVENAK